jgi:hypothetical protein
MMYATRLNSGGRYRERDRERERERERQGERKGERERERTGIEWVYVCSLVLLGERGMDYIWFRIATHANGEKVATCSR